MQCILMCHTQYNILFLCHTVVVMTALSSALMTPCGTLHCSRAPGLCSTTQEFDRHMPLQLSLTKTTAACVCKCSCVEHLQGASVEQHQGANHTLAIQQYGEHALFFPLRRLQCSTTSRLWPNAGAVFVCARFRWAVKICRRVISQAGGFRWYAACEIAHLWAQSRTTTSGVPSQLCLRVSSRYSSAPHQTPGLSSTKSELSGGEQHLSAWWSSE